MSQSPERDQQSTHCAIIASGISHRWAMRRNRMSQNYTTDWNDLPEAR